MKQKLLSLILFASLSITTLGNDFYDNFYAENGYVVWNRHYQTSDSFEDLIKKVKISGLLTNIEVVDNYIIGDLKPKGLNLTLFDNSGLRFNPRSFYESQIYNGVVVIKFQKGIFSVEFKNIFIVFANHTETERNGSHII